MDFDHILRKYIEGLIGEAISRLGVGMELEDSNKVNKLQNVLDQLK